MQWIEPRGVVTVTVVAIVVVMVVASALNVVCLRSFSSPPQPMGIFIIMRSNASVAVVVPPGPDYCWSVTAQMH